MAELGKLGEIIEAKRAEVKRRLGEASIETMRAAATRSSHSLLVAMGKPGARFIFEFKRRSPSEGALRDGADPAAIARCYTGAADAMSVLTDEHFFGGSLDDLRSVRAAFDGPILAKDFIVDPRQLVEARLAGADAGLAILAVLDDDEVRELFAEAERLAMDILVEVHDEGEIRRALALGAPLIGINNRDLKSFRIDLSVTERLAPMAADRIVISESGINSRAEVERLAPLVDGFLIGSSVMRSDDPREAARALAFGRVKLCGLRTASDLEAAEQACYAGLVFVPGTPRAVTVDEAALMVASARAHPPLVGVFRDAPIDEVIDATRRLPLHAVQLHGSEDADYVAKLRREYPGEIWQAVTVDQARADGDRILFDSGSGGSGQSFDWSQIADRPDLGNSILAGGIGAHNARPAMQVGAHAIDVGSSVDERPGTKSHAKIASLFEALRPASKVREVRRCA